LKENGEAVWRVGVNLGDGSSGREPTYQVPGPEFNLQCHMQKKKKKCLSYPMYPMGEENLRLISHI
jgi:hypothetical protein